ncbi:MAG TPA: hypothetical protein VMT03_17525, partial [Polyangia bacterium]|nr:hypothetical protein [Polyangia bacterium]
LVFDVTNANGFSRWWRGRPRFGGSGWGLTIDMRFDPLGKVGLADVEITRQGGAGGRFRLAERYFPPEQIEDALEASGFRTVVQQPWSPFDGDSPGKTWWVARLAGS